MLYLMQGTDSYGFCLGDCDCNSTSCNKKTCTVKRCTLNHGNVCPEHCWAQVCTTAKVDPFSFNI